MRAHAYAISMLVGLGGASCAHRATLDYGPTVNTAHVGQADRRSFLQACLASMEGSERLRAVADSTFRGASGGAVLLETTNFGFPEYKFIVVSEEFTWVGSADRGEVSRRPTGESAQTVLHQAMSEADNLVSDASDSAWDGDCHFLSVRSSSRVRQAAVYETTNGATQVIVERLLRMLRYELRDGAPSDTSMP